MILLSAIIAIVVFITFEIFVFWRRRKFSKRDMAFVVSQWETLRADAVRRKNHAVFEADKLLDFVLKKRGYTGPMGDKLKKAKFTRPDDVWKAHKLRNRIAHETGFQVTEQEARRALSSYKQALWDLGVKLS